MAGRTPPPPNGSCETTDGEYDSWCCWDDLLLLERPSTPERSADADEPKRKSFSIVSAEVDDDACFFDGCVVLSDVVDLRFPRGKATGSDMVT